MSCKLALNAASKDDARRIEAYWIECKNAVANLIGYKSKGLVRAAEKAYKEKPTAENKQKLFLAKRKQKEHHDLFDLLVDDMMLNASETDFNKQIVDPVQMAEDWRMSFSKRLIGEITPVTIFQGTRTIRAVKRTVQKMIKKREKILKSGKINKKLIWGAPPEFVAQAADRFGFMQKLINKALRLSDRDISITSKFSVAIDKARAVFTDSLKQAFKQQNLRDVFNLNNSSLWGMGGIDGLPFRIKGTAEDILIVGETMVNNVPHFRIKRPNEEDSGIETVPKDEVNASDDDIREAFIALYRDELTNEIMDGQVRRIVPSVLDKTIDTVEDEAGVIDKEDPDFGRAKAKVRQMAKEKTEGDDKGNRVPGVHEKEVVQGNMTWRYRYFMVKQGEGAKIVENPDGSPNTQESYKVYLLSKVAIEGGKEIEGSGVNFIGRTFEGIFDGKATYSNESYTQNEVDSVFFGVDDKGDIDYRGRDSIWMRAQSTNDYGRRLYPRTTGQVKKGDPIPGTHTKQYTNFEVLENEPHEKLMPMVWNLVGELRNQMDLVWRDMSSKAKKVERQRQILNDRLEARWKKQGLSQKKIKELKEYYSEIGGIQSQIRWSKDGALRTANTYAKKKSENYVPHMYTHSSVREQIMTQINVIENKIDRAEDEGRLDKVEDLKLGLVHLSDMLKSLTGDETPTKMLDLLNVPFMKHITAWTDQTKRRKDGNIYGEYLNHAYRNIHRNEIIVEMLGTIDKMSQVSLPDGSVEYLSNRIKMAFGDSDTRAMTWWGRETGYQKTADNLNKLPNFMRLGVEFDAASAEKLTKWFTTPATMAYLGAVPALGNQTQIVNQIIQVGWRIYSEAGRTMKTHDDMWKRVIQNTGVLNVLTMFSDIMMVDGDPDWNDFAFLPTTTIPNPLKMKELGDMLRLGRESFINSRDDRIDAMLIKMEMRAQGKSKEYIREMQDIRELRKEVDEAIVRKKAGQLYDFYTLDEKQSEELITKRFKALVGDVTDAKIKRWVTWKLSWWFNNAPGADIFTFKKGEEKLRSKTVVMALLHAQEKGLLGNVTKEEITEGLREDVLMSDMAKKIARDAVYATQFGMTPMYLGEGFNGMGRLFFQYKQYPTLQSIYDYQTIEKFRAGGYGTMDSINRLAVAFKDAGINSYKKHFKGDKTVGYDVTDPNLDHEALAMIRFIFTRLTASVISTMISTVPFAARLMRGVGGDTAFNMIRSGESPALGFALRIMVWTSLMAMAGDDDDRHGALDEIFGNFQFLLMPVLFSMLLQNVTDAIDLFED